MFRKFLLRVSTMNKWQKFKYILLYLGSLLLLYSFFIRLTPNIRVIIKSSKVNLQYVTVHFDLKGSPPKLSYILSLLPILSKHGVNSILLEYEDMFPYEGSIVNISSKNPYTRTEISKLITEANSLHMEIIPLIQTFGHMQFVLKLKEFAHLREQKNVNSDICPSNQLSQKLITSMLKQVIDLHATIKPLKHIHIGCDEVLTINKCLECTKRKLKTTDLFINHVKEVASIVKKLSPATKVLIWGDMLLQVKKPQKFNLNDIEAVVWEYSAHPQFSHKYFYNLHKNFKSIWIASAFKGADGNKATIPDISKRFRNHLSWMRMIIDYKFGGEKKAYYFKGIILTGWSRYTHDSPQCELLPFAMPSLILNLLLVKTVKKGFDKDDLNLPYCEFFKKYLRKEFRENFRSYDDTDENCAFENTFFYKEQETLFNKTLLYNCVSNLHEHDSQCHSVGSEMYVTTLDGSFALCAEALKKLADMENDLKSYMVQYYKNHVIKSYIDQIVQVPVQKVKTMMKKIKDCTKGNTKN